MKRMDGKARMMVMGAGIGAASAALLVALAASGRIGGWGILAVMMLAGVTGFGGWLLGYQTRARMDRARIWLEGYMDGRKEPQIDIRVQCYKAAHFLEKAILEKPGR